MGLNPRGRGRGRGGKGNFPNKGRRGGGMAGQGPMFRPGPPNMFGPPPMGFPPEPPFGAPFFGGPSGFNYAPPRPAFGKFPRNNFKRRNQQKSNNQPVPEIDLTKPWVTEEIKSEEAKKQEYLETWRKSKDDGDWSKYKAQKLTVQTLYDKAKEEYIQTHPDEAAIWQTVTTPRKYFCETCDKSFRTDDDFILHEAEHETCGREGCEFTAHPKILSKHIKMQHDSGLYKRIGKLYSEEDIAKWIEERKKRYPSRKVIEEKKAIEQEKIKRGELIKEDDSKFNKTFQKQSNRKRSFEKKTLRKHRSKKRRKSPPLQFHLEEEISDNRKGVPAFVGIKKIYETEESTKEEENNFNISDEEWDANNCAQPTTKPIINNSLGLLASNYDSDEEIIEDKCQAKTEAISAGEESGPEEVKTVVSKSVVDEKLDSEKSSLKRKLNKRKDHLREKNQKKSYVSSNNSGKRYCTLLEKLLKNEIRHERNVILQCVRYIVNNNFFKT